jgi:WhiB family transcriptional regulator, redox-sensing transcriptional regulator
MDMEHTNWRGDAACLHADPDLFFPIGTAGPVLRDGGGQADLPSANAVPDVGTRAGRLRGIWGGTTEDERRAIRKTAVSPAIVARAGSQTWR